MRILAFRVRPIVMHRLASLGVVIRTLTTAGLPSAAPAPTFGRLTGVFKVLGIRRVLGAFAVCPDSTPLTPVARGR